MALDYLRMQNIMGGANMGGSINEDPFQTAPQRQSPFDVMDGTSMMPPPVQTQNSVFDSQKRNGIHPDTDQAMMRLKSILDSYQPDTTSVDRNNRLLDSAPQINNPSAMRRFAAMGQSIGNVDSHFRRTGGGPDAADRVLYAPYLQQMADWKEKTGPFATAAANENQRNIQERTLTGNMFTAQSAQDRIMQQEAEAERKAGIADEKNAIARTAAEAKAENDRQRTAIAQAAQSGAKFRFDNGHLFAVYANGGPNGDLSVDLGEYKDNTKIGIEGMRDATARDVATTRAGATTGAATIRAGASTDAANIRAGATGAGKGMTPAAIAANRRNIASQIVAMDRTLAPYIKVENNQVVLTEPKGNIFGAPDPAIVAKYKAALAKIYADSPPPKSGDTLVPKAPDPALRQRAIDFLKSANLPVEEANIDHAIKTGRVK